jgi:hypothetical protein
VRAVQSEKGQRNGVQQILPGLIEMAQNTFNHVRYFWYGHPFIHRVDIL